MKNIDKYKEDLKNLIVRWEMLYRSMQYECHPEAFEKRVKPVLNEKYDSFLKKLKPFKETYQSQYSESLVLIKQLLPHRVSDFVKLYEKPKNRKSIEYGNCVIEDYLQGLVVTIAYQRKVGPEAAISQFEQQFQILKSVERRFESTLFDIKQIVQADLFDSEIDTAKELNKKGFVRGAGAITGVILEKHLAQVCVNHNIVITKKNPSISDLNDKLKNSEVYDTPVWRKIQHMGDLRNLCDHNKETEPTKQEVEELINGVAGLIKTIY